MSYEPSNASAEQSVLGALAIDNDSLGLVSAMVKPEHFYSVMHRDIYKAILSLSKKGQSFDVITISDEVAGFTGENAFGYIGEIIKNTPSSANIIGYTKIVIEKYKEREMIAALEASLDKVKSGEGSTSERLHHSIANVCAVDPNEANHEANLKHVESIGMAWLNSYEDRIDNPDRKGITLGMADVDEIIGSRGSLPGDVISIAARPKMGKTALAVKIAKHIAEDLRKPVAIFSMEMADEQLMGRMLTQGSGVSNDKFYGHMSDSDHGLIHNAMGNIINSQMYIDDRKGLSIAQIESEARQFVKSQGGYGSVAAMFFDYLTLIRIENATMGKAAAFAEVSMRITALAGELGFVAFPLAQLNKKCEERNDKRPISTDMGDTDQLIRDCSISLFLYKDSVYDKQSAMGNITEVIMRDNRNGDTGTGYQMMNQGQFLDIDASEVGRVIAEAEYQSRMSQQ